MERKDSDVNAIKEQSNRTEGASNSALDKWFPTEVGVRTHYMAGRNFPDPGFVLVKGSTILCDKEKNPTVFRTRKQAWAVARRLNQDRPLLDIINKE